VSSPAVAGAELPDATAAVEGDTPAGAGRTKNVTRKAAFAASERARKIGSVFMGRSQAQA
jgi:hypothetical protein